jgi:predicted ATPase
MSLKYTFDLFVIGSSNRSPTPRRSRSPEAPAQAYNPLFIYGGTGLGKTHLLQAVGQYVGAHGNGLTSRYVTSETFMNDFINSLRDKRIEGSSSATAPTTCCSSTTSSSSRARSGSRRSSSTPSTRSTRRGARS